MTIRDFLPLVYHAFGGEIAGNTLLQKRMYFLGLQCKKQFEYTPNYYGPFSTSVADANTQLYLLGFLSRTTVHGSEPLHRLTNAGLRLVDAIIKEYPEEWKQIRKAVHSLRDLTCATLVIASKAHSSTPGVKDQGAAREACRKARHIWQANDDETEHAVTLLCSENI